MIERGYDRSPLDDKPGLFDMPLTPMAAVAAGTVTPADAGEVMKLFEGLARTIETSEIERRLRALEDGAPSAGAHREARPMTTSGTDRALQWHHAQRCAMTRQLFYRRLRFRVQVAAFRRHHRREPSWAAMRLLWRATSPR